MSFQLVLVVPGLSGKNQFQGDNVKKNCPLRGRMSLPVAEKPEFLLILVVPGLSGKN
jgi:hypothetical protein